MQKKSSTKTLVKVQIPVSRELADELARWAKEMQLTQARLCEILLEFAMEKPNGIGEWLTVRVRGPWRKGKRAGWLQLGDNSAVRLQVSIDEKLANKIEAMANRLNQTGVRFAALLLDFALADEKFGMRVLTTTVGKSFMRLFGKLPEPYESAELEDDQ
jgi:hypothetical protein